MKNTDWTSPCGRARIILGDCLSVLPSLPDASVHMIFTDPPFGHKNNDGDLIGNREKALGKGPEGPARPIKNDGKIAHGLFLWSLYQYERLLVSAGCCCCCCGGGGPDPMFGKWALWMDDVMRFKQMIVWDKGKMGMGWHYRRSYETVLVAEKRGTGKARWFDESHRVENIIRPGDYGIKKIIPNKDQHPTQKPIALSSHFIGLHSQPGETILDPYMGRGSTGIAALRSGRKFIGIEIDPEHFHKAKELIEKEAAQ